MEDEFLGHEVFVSMMKIHSGEILDLLISESVDFTILANLDGVFFEPELPSNITKHFKPIITFTLKNYTLSSASVAGDVLQFETGFGSGDDMIGALVSVHLQSILQIFVGNEPIFINRAIPKSFDEELDELTQELEEEAEEDGANKSLKAFMSNPNNKKLFD